MSELQAAINSLHGKTVTIKVKEGGGKLSSAQVESITSKVQSVLLQQAQRNKEHETPMDTEHDSPGDYRTCRACDTAWGSRSVVVVGKTETCPSCGAHLEHGVTLSPSLGTLKRRLSEVEATREMLEAVEREREWLRSHLPPLEPGPEPEADEDGSPSA